jgi:hypothetical protein
MTNPVVRALRQGFTKDVFHGTYAPDIKNLKRSDLGVHVGTPGQANERIGMWGGEGELSGQNILPLKARIKNSLRMPDVEEWKDPYEVWLGLPPELQKKISMTPEEIDKFMDIDYYDLRGDQLPAAVKKKHKEIRDTLKKEGYDSVVYHNTKEPSTSTPAQPGSEWSDEFNYEDSYIVLDPKNLKSKFAPFKKKGMMGAALPTHLAGTAALGVGGIEAIKSEKMGKIADALRRGAKNPVLGTVLPLEGMANLADKYSYGDPRTFMDYFEANPL